MQKKPHGTKFELPSIGSYKSRVGWESVAWRKLLAHKELLDLLITLHEKHDLVMRAAALERLNAGKSYSQIGEEFWLSPQTISGIKKSINEKGYKSYLERSKKERKKKQYTPGPKRGTRRPSGRPVRTKYGTIYAPY